MVRGSHMGQKPSQKVSKLQEDHLRGKLQIMNTEADLKKTSSKNINS